MSNLTTKSDRALSVDRLRHYPDKTPEVPDAGHGPRYDVACSGYLRRRLASGEGIVSLGVRLSRCHAALGNALYP